MSVIYRDELKTKATDNFSKLLSETQEYFSSQFGTNIMGRDIESIFTTNSLFESYKEKLTENCDAQTADALNVMLDSVREECLLESTGGVQPYASLTMPVLVKLWARLAMKYAIPTEPVTKPAFAVAFMKPYVFDANGDKQYLPEAINNTPETIVNKDQLTATVALTDGKVEDYNLFTGLTGANTAKGDVVDRKFSIVAAGKAAVEESGTEGQAGYVPASEAKTYKTNIVLDINRRLYGEIFDSEGNHVDTIFGSVDLEKAKLTIATLKGAIDSVQILGWKSSESHTSAINVSFDIDRRDIEIGTGTHIEANVPLELLQDTKAMYDIDGTAEVVEIMSNVSAQKVDLDIIEFIQKAYTATESGNFHYNKSFDVYPKGNYALSPAEWNEGLKKLIDYMAQSMKNDFKSYDGYFVVVGNPIDTMLIPNVNWTFQNVNDEMNGVTVNYSLGAVAGANRYSIISSDLMTAGALYIFLVPTVDKYKTFVYYPYTFNVVNNYLNTRMQNVPSIMLTRRYTLEEFMPIIGKIDIVNNDGSVYARDRKTNYNA
jgi:hypothetical protein